jgi:predicted nucleic acid-binding protein
MIFLDTDVMIDLLRQHPPAVAWLGSLRDEEIVLPGFVVMDYCKAAEIRCSKQGAKRC